jgi:hypothetical protein
MAYIFFFQYVSNSTNLISISTNNLIPDSAYKLYCYTEDTRGYSMELSTVISGEAEYIYIYIYIYVMHIFTFPHFY